MVTVRTTTALRGRSTERAALSCAHTQDHPSLWWWGTADDFGLRERHAPRVRYGELCSTGRGGAIRQSHSAQRNVDPPSNAWQRREEGALRRGKVMRKGADQQQDPKRTNSPCLSPATMGTGNQPLTRTRQPLGYWHSVCVREFGEAKPSTVEGLVELSTTVHNLIIIMTELGPVKSGVMCGVDSPTTRYLFPRL